MIKYDKIKIVLFDFDDTLAVHSEHKEYNERTRMTYDVNMLKGNTEYFSERCKKSRAMEKFITKLQKDGKKLALISQVETTSSGNCKIIWAETQYNAKFINCCVSLRKLKVDMLKVVAETFTYLPENILIVDDHCKTLSEAQKAGFQSCTPIEVVNYMEGVK